MTQIMRVIATVPMERVGEVLALLQGKVSTVNYEVVEIVDRRRKKPDDHPPIEPAPDLLALLKKGPMQSRDLKAASRLTDSTFYYRLGVLRDAKKVKVNKDGEVRLT